MDQERDDYAGHRSRSRLPNPANLALFAASGMGVLLIVGGFIVAVTFIDRLRPTL
jgi:hypothetical protein